MQRHGHKRKESAAGWISRRRPLTVICRNLAEIVELQPAKLAMMQLGA
jgi:hypothetical protein